MDADALLDTLHNRCEVVRVETLEDKLFQVQAEALDDTIANKLSQVAVEKLGKTLVDVEV